MFTLLGIIACSASFGRRYRTCDANMLLLAVGTIWFVHIGADRALGYGLKYATGFGDTHLSDSSRSPMASR